MAWVGGGKRMVADLTGPPCMECCRWKRLGDSFAFSDALLICLLVMIWFWALMSGYPSSYESHLFFVAFG